MMREAFSDLTAQQRVEFPDLFSGDGERREEGQGSMKGERRGGEGGGAREGAFVA